MLGRLKGLFVKKPVPWQDRIQDLWRELVPVGGEAETLQGELVRSIQNLSDEAFRNGYINWSEKHEEFIKVLERYLRDRQTFDAQALQELRDDLAHVRRSGRTLQEEGELSDMAYESLTRIARRVVEWCDAHPELIYRPEGQIFLAAMRTQPDPELEQIRVLAG
jgi:hypothetical protein